MKNSKGFYVIDLEGDEPSVEKIDLKIRPQFEIEVEEDRIEELL